MPSGEDFVEVTSHRRPALPSRVGLECFALDRGLVAALRDSLAYNLDRHEVVRPVGVLQNVFFLHRPVRQRLGAGLSFHQEAIVSVPGRHPHPLGLDLAVGGFLSVRFFGPLVNVISVSDVVGPARVLGDAGFALACFLACFLRGRPLRRLRLPVLLRLALLLRRC